MGLYRGGRPKGTKNKATDLHGKCAKVGLDVFERLLELALKQKDEKGEWGKLMQLAQYLYARPKEVSEVEISPEQVREMIREWTKDVQPTGS